MPSTRCSFKKAVRSALSVFTLSKCVEKYLKAVLIYHSIPSPRTHDLLELLPMVPADLGLGGHLADLASINRYSVELRYPGDWDPIEREDAEEAVSIAKKLREDVRSHLPKEILGD